MMRFSLATLLLAVLIAAIGCAALVNANDLWRQTMVSVVVTMLVVATLAATVRRGQSRVFALGFAVTGWIYLVLVYVSVCGLRADLLTDKVVAVLFTTIHGDEASQQLSIQNVAFTSSGSRYLTSSNNGGIVIWNTSTGQPVTANGGRNVNNFADIGHTVWVVIVAWLGGVVAKVLAIRNPTEDGEAPAETN